MTRRWRISLSVLTIVMLAVCLETWRFLSHPSLTPYSALNLKLPAARPGALKAQFMGVTTVSFDDGETQILVDGFFTRPGPIQLLLGKIGPDESVIDESLKRAGINRLAAVLVAHSHHDHAMDSPVVAKKTGAVMVGTESTANIGRGSGLPESQIRVVKGGEIFQFGRFRVTVFKSPHSPKPLYPGVITEPLAQPAKASAFKEGGNCTFLVEHDGSSILVLPSANFIVGLYKNVRADVVFLGIARLGKQTDEFVKDYWREVVETTGAKVVIPIHWDDFTKSLDGPLVPMPLLMDNFDRGMKLVLQMADRDGVSVSILPTFEPVDILAAAKSSVPAQSPK